MTRRRVAASISLAAALSAGMPPAGATTLANLQKKAHDHGLTVDPAGATKLFRATHHDFFVVTPNGKATLLSPVQDCMGFTPHPADSGILYASGHSAGGDNLGLIVSVDGRATWMQMAQGVGGPVDFHQIDISPADPKMLYGVRGRVQVSDDGGRSWTDAAFFGEIVSLVEPIAGADILAFVVNRRLMAAKESDVGS